MRLGRYETLRPIASGGMATVHLARALGAGGFERLVALKVLHPHIAAEPDFVAMFLDEARLAASIRHPNVVATMDVQEDPLFLVMDYVEGPALHVVLRELRKRSERMPLDIILRVFIDVLAGLDAAHDLKGPDGQPLCLIHRDVSPQNVLIGSDGISRITDFGVARASSRLSSTRGGQVKGKLAYMAPEQIRSQELDRRVDVYAAGVVLWELLANQPLFRGESDAAVLAQIIQGPAKRPRELFPELAQGIDDACMKSLATEREDRFATAASFADALEHAAHEARVAIASPRAVAAWIKKLGAHDEAPTLGTALADASSPGSRSGRTALPVAAPAEPGASSSTSVGTLVAPTPLTPKRGVGAMVAIVAAVAAAVAIGGWAMTRGGPDGASNASRPAEASASSASASPPSSATAAKEAAQASAAPTASVTVLDKPTTTTSTAVTPTPPKTAPTQLKPRSTAFRPGGL